MSNLLWSCIAAHSAFMTLRERRSERVAVVTQLFDHDPEPPTGPQPVLLAA